jgi:hypothetical protein
MRIATYRVPRAPGETEEAELGVTRAGGTASSNALPASPVACTGARLRLRRRSIMQRDSGCSVGPEVEAGDYPRSGDEISLR